MTAPVNAISLSIVDSPDFGSEVLKALYRITGRSTVELRNSVRAGEPVYTAGLFGKDHIDVVPRLEKTIAYLDGLGVAFVLHEWNDGTREEITVPIMREILDAADEQGS